VQLGLVADAINQIIARSSLTVSEKADLRSHNAAGESGSAIE
jgi:hypothetical protein